MAWVQARDRGGRVLALPNQTPGLLDRFGLTREEVDREAWVIDPADRKFAGAAAINRVLEELGGVWALISRAYRFPPLRRLEDRLYAWVARNRSRLKWIGF